MKKKRNIIIILIVILVILVATEIYILINSDVLKKDSSAVESQTSNQVEIAEEKDKPEENNTEKEEHIPVQEKKEYTFFTFTFEADAFYKASGYAGSSNHAIYLNDNIAYELLFDGADTVTSDTIATNVDKIDTIQGSLIVYINDNTVLNDKYTNYSINTDNDGNKYITVR